MRMFNYRRFERKPEQTKVSWLRTYTIKSFISFWVKLAASIIHKEASVDLKTLGQV